MRRFSIFGGNAKTIENLLLHIDLFPYIDVFSNLLPIILFLVLIKKVGKVNGLRIACFYALCNFVINFGVILTSTSNTIFYEVLTAIEFLLFLSFIFLNVINKKIKTLIIAFGVAFVLFFLTYTLLAKAVRGIDSVPIGVETIIILGFSFYYLYERMHDTTTLFIYNTYQFWVILGIVLYLAGSFFIYIFAGYLRNHDIEDYWFITNIFATIKNIFFCISIYIYTKPSKESIQYNLELSRLN